MPSKMYNFDVSLMIQRLSGGRVPLIGTSYRYASISYPFCKTTHRLFISFHLPQLLCFTVNWQLLLSIPEGLRGTYRIRDSQPFIALRLPQLPGPGLAHYPFPETHRGVAAPASWH